MKVTAFWGHKLGLNLNNTVFHIKLKKIIAPDDWVFDLRNKNLSTEWVNIGEVTWKKDIISYKLPDDINNYPLKESGF
jgi:hypothetical protein